MQIIVKAAAKIAIIGGGIGGLTSALALRQVGFAPEVFEQAPELLEVGAAIALWPNAMRVVEQLGLGTEILRHAGTIEQVRWLDSQGRLLNSVRLPEGKSPSVALHRADLQSILWHALPAGSVHLGKVFQSLQPQSKESQLSFADGSQITYEMLLGCDGLHSRVRSQIGAAQPPRFRGYTVWRGITRFSSTQLETRTAIEVHGNGRRFGIGPVGLNRIGWWATANKRLTRPQQINDHASHDESAGQPFDNQHELLRLFQGWWQPINELLAATPATSIVRTDAFDRPATKRWGQGLVTLLGDAIHPTTPNLGQGGCMAIEDAVVLARCLEKYGPTADALRRYEALRYRRTRSVTGYSRLYGSIGQWERSWITRMRRTGFSLVPQSMALRLLRMVFDYDAYRVSI